MHAYVGSTYYVYGIGMYVFMIPSADMSLSALSFTLEARMGIVSKRLSARVLRNVRDVNKENRGSLLLSSFHRHPKENVWLYDRVERHPARAGLSVLLAHSNRRVAHSDSVYSRRVAISENTSSSIAFFFAWGGKSNWN